MPARTRKIRHDDETRAKIQAGVIIDRLMKCIKGEISLDSSQVSAAKALLNKCLPDLQAVELSGDVTTSYVFKGPEPLHSVEEWQNKHLPPTVQ